MLSAWARALPTRIVEEELGDYMEDISRRRAAGEPETRIQLRIACAILATGYNALVYVLKSARQKASK